MINDVIKLENIYKIYKQGQQEIYALNNVSLTVKKGEFISIIGQSGSGKSTLMNICGCLDCASSGIYYLDNNIVENMTDNQLAEIRNQKIGFIFQGFNLIPTLTALENVELPLVYRKINKNERRQLSLNAIERVGLKSREKHKPCELSGGQQQRIAIARAIASKPSIILADEPTGNLDSKSGENIIEILSQLNAEGCTIVMITHDSKVAKKAQKIYEIADGQIVL